FDGPNPTFKGKGKLWVLPIESELRRERIGQLHTFQKIGFVPAAVPIRISGGYAYFQGGGCTIANDGYSYPDSPDNRANDGVSPAQPQAKTSVGLQGADGTC